MRKQTAIWTTKEGKRVRICDMTDSHLVNTIRYLDRYVHSMELAHACALEQMFDSAAEDDLIGGLESEDHECDMPPIYEKLCREAKRRGLEPTQ